ASAIAPFIALAASAGGVCSAEKPSYNQVVSQSCRARLLSIHFPDGKSLTDIFSPYLDNYHYSPVYSASGTATHISSGTASMGTSQERHYQDENTWEEGYKYILMLAAVRSSGLWAEKKMFETTGGLNTHKGAVFVLGVVASALEYSLAQIMRQVDITDAGRILEEACEIVKKMCKGIVSRELGGATLQHGLNVKNNNSGEKLQEPGASSTSSLTSSRYLTHGEKLYLKYGFTGVRGEAEEGFQTVFRAAIPVLYSLAFSYNKAADMSERSLTEIKCGESGVIPTLSFFVPHLKYPELLKLLLLYIMGRVQDSNVFWRGGPEVYSEWKRKADEKLQLFLKIISEISQKIKADSKQIIKDCVKETPAKMLSEALNELHHFALQHNISPGGAADMLSASIYAAKRIALMLNIRKI
ncbi:MAG: triphosphoribosyl-dephospho-CoA synthase, partial [Thermoplasmata archaeon]